MIETVKTFNSSNWMLFFNDKGLGEISCLEFDSFNKGKELEITIQVMQNDAAKIDEYLRGLKDANIKEIFASDNEAKSLVREYRKVTFKGITTIRHLDFCSVFDTYIFSCEEVTGLKEIGGNCNE